MPLIACPDCGQQISPRADFCPHCGCPSKFFNVDAPAEFSQSAVSQSAQPTVGQNFVFGRYKGSAIEWRVLAIEDDKALLITDKGLVSRHYHWHDNGLITWEMSDLRAWLNDEFLDKAFTPEEKAKIDLTHVVSSDNLLKGIPGGADTDDYVFCLSADEAERYFASDDDRICCPTELAKKQGAWIGPENTCFWWLRSPGAEKYYTRIVLVDGDIANVGDDVTHEDFLVRPALWLQL